MLIVPHLFSSTLTEQVRYLTVVRVATTTWTFTSFFDD